MTYNIDKLVALKKQIEPQQYILKEQAQRLFKKEAIKLMKKFPEIIEFRCGLTAFTYSLKTKNENVTVWFGTMREYDSMDPLSKKDLHILEQVDNTLGPIIRLGTDIIACISRNKNGTPKDEADL